ncbi:hypothetical protein BDV19DRAFT_394466 [Aspergillus venezuelensis]
MPITTSFSLPANPDSLFLPANATAEGRFFISFHASIDPATKKSLFFQRLMHRLLRFVEVGLRPEWKDHSNTFHKKWNIVYVPTLVRFERDVADGKVKGTGAAC